MYPAFRYRHWAGFGDHTHPFGLAVTCVFIKQSEPPCHCDLPLREAGTPSPEVTGPVCRVPSPGLSPTHLGLLTQGHLCQFSVRSPQGNLHALFTGTRNRSNPPQLEGPSRLHPLLAITALRGLQRLDGATAPLDLSGCVMHGVSALRWRRNINRLPFRPARLRQALGPANPRLTNIAVEPLAPPVVGILTRLCCYFRRDSRPCAVHWTSRPSFYPRTAPPYPISFRSARVSAAGLAPSIFGARSLGG